jgi:hypothetical protein
MSFLCFEGVSGLKINLAKSKIVLVGDVGDVEGLARILGCTISLSASYKALKKWNVGFLGGRSFIYLREVD